VLFENSKEERLIRMGIILKWILKRSIKERIGFNWFRVGYSRWLL
jgi:hypothetical protein